MAGTHSVDKAGPCLPERQSKTFDVTPDFLLCLFIVLLNKLKQPHPSLETLVFKIERLYEWNSVRKDEEANCPVFGG